MSDISSKGFPRAYFFQDCVGNTGASEFGCRTPMVGGVAWEILVTPKKRCYLPASSTNIIDASCVAFNVDSFRISRTSIWHGTSNAMAIWTAQAAQAGWSYKRLVSGP